MAALAAGNVNLDALISHTFRLEDAVQAMERFADSTSKSVKVQIVDDPNA